MTDFTIVVLPGDGIGPEVTRAAVGVLDAVGERYRLRFHTQYHPIGAAALRAGTGPLPEQTREAVQQADAVLLGAVGDPAFDLAPRDARPETGLLALRSLLGVYANLRPVSIYPALAACSPLRPERLSGVDLLIVRELTGGLYYGEPRGRTADAAVNTLRYTTREIQRVARVGFESARGRRRKLLSVDKANVLETSQLWRETVSALSREYPDVTLEHLYVDYAAMRLVNRPASIDVLVTENMFGDILSDEAGVLAGSLGLLPSASLGRGPGLFEPVHGSAPDIAGRDVANPIGAIASVGMLLRSGLGQAEAADAVEQAIRAAIQEGARTLDIAQPGDRVLGTTAVGERIAELVTELPEPGRESAVQSSQQLERF